MSNFDPDEFLTGTKTHPSLIPEEKELTLEQRRRIAHASSHQEQRSYGNAIAWALVAVVVVISIAAFIKYSSTPPGFAMFGGYHKELVTKVKSAMHNPASFEHVETIRKPNGTEILMVARGSNALGGIVTNAYEAKLDKDGKLLEFKQSGSSVDLK